ncbi:MAG: family 16 glycoside hydrolase [Verrucomicrobiota bacterium]
MSLRLLALLALVSPLCAAEAPATLLAQPDKEIVADGLTKDSPAADWKVVKGKWERTADGVRVEEIPADKHGAVSRVAQKLQDLVIAFEFRLDGAKSVSLSINATKDHMARVHITPTALRVQKDDNDHDGPDKAVVFLNSTQAFEAGTWHRVVLEMVGDTMVATIDGKLSAFGSDPLFKTEKVSPGFTCAGQSATFRNFALWSAKTEPKATWKETSVKVAEAMAAAPKPAAPAAKGKAAAKGKGKAKAAK